MGAALTAAALVLGMAACSSGDDTMAGETTPQPTVQTATTIHVTVGAGITDPTPDPSPTGAGSSATRSAVDYNTSTGKRTLKFTTGDRLYIDRDILGDGSKRLAGQLTLVGEPTNGGLSATFEGDVKVYASDGSETSYDFGSSDPLTGSTATLWHKDLTPGLITLNTDHSQAYHQDQQTAAGDVETLMTTMLLVQGGYTQGTGYQLSAASMTQPIMNCDILGLTSGATYQVDYLSGATAEMTGATKTLSNGMTATGGILAFAFIAQTGSLYHGIRLTNTANPSDTHTLAIGQNTFAAKVYNVNRYWDGSTFSKTINLATVNNDLTVPNGMTLTGELGGNYKISIASGATVTLSGATIPGRNATDNTTQWAGITCLGDATIMLAEGTTNYVKGYNPDYPGIQAGPAGTTLTIRGLGTLTAKTGMGSSQGYAAGIGGGRNLTVGNIRIEDGTIIARGDHGSSGIGSGYAYNVTVSCGDITITGGNITATGGVKAAGIGSGRSDRDLTNTCSSIFIKGGTVKALGGLEAAGIGSGYDYGCSCGNIIISGGSVQAMSGSNNSDNIGAGNHGTCGTVSVEGGSIIPPSTCTFTVKFYQSMTAGLPSLEAYQATANRLDVYNGEWTYRAIGPFQTNSTITVNMPEMNNATLTITSPSTNYYENAYSQSESDLLTATFSYTLTGVDITSSANLGTVSLVKQQ